MRAPSTLIAIGGDGATQCTVSGLDRFCLAFAPMNPRIGFIGAASKYDPAKFERFKTTFARFVSEVSDLRSDASEPEISRWIDAQDMIYLGGGNPVYLIDNMKENGLNEALMAASHIGKILVGVSAGAMCWFEAFLWRDATGALSVANGLDAIAGSMTPHSLIEPERVTCMKTLVSSGGLPNGFAIDDGAALVFRDGLPAETFTQNGQVQIHRLSR